MPRHALVVDDDTVTRLVLCHMLQSLGWSVDQVGDVPDALDRLRERDVDLVVADFHLPSGTGIDVLEAAEQRAPAPAFILVTGIIEHSSLSSDIAPRLAAQLTKPVGSEMLRSALGRVFPSEDA
ncbi:response regulator [Microbacterium sp. SSW1-49]|uniref:Response regulator n=1 Tax=Microbacterium croceum TaxID=2851645 RepID=A0ABT0FHL2_9MICO|nr:response regulator [Microbacterium croceum]MCK2037540.1 response regulator [Microbacterium croceum]